MAIQVTEWVPGKKPGMESVDLSDDLSLFELGLTTLGVKWWHKEKDGQRCLMAEEKDLIRVGLRMLPNGKLPRTIQQGKVKR